MEGARAVSEEYDNKRLCGYRTQDDVEQRDPAWTVRMEARKVGRLDVEVVCYNSNGVASEPACER